MSAIGDYVHYRYGNYLAMGNAEPGTIGQKQTETNLMNYFNAQRNKTAMANSYRFNMDRTNYIAELKSAIEGLLGFKKNKKINDELLDRVWNQLVEWMKERFGDSLGEIGRSGIVYAKTNSKNNVTIHKVDDQFERHYAIKIRDKIDIILKNLSEDFQDYSLVKNNLEQIKADLEDMFGDFTKETSKVKKGATLLTRQEFTALFEQDIIGLVNKLIEALQVSKRVISQTGALTEYVTFIGNAIVNNQTEEALNKTLKEVNKTVTGENRSTVVVDLSTARVGSRELLANELKKAKYSTDDGIVYTYVSNTQDKVDVEVGTRGYKGMASVKGYNLKKSNRDIALLGGSPMYQLLQHLDTDFVNHYLNVTVQHGENRNPQMKVLNAAHSAMKAQLFALGIQDHKNKGKKADLLIIVDNTGKRVFIWPIDTLLMRINEILFLKGINVRDGSHHGPDISTIKLINSWIAATNYSTSIGRDRKGKYDTLSKDAADLRIANLLVELYKQKIYISINSNALGISKI